MSHEVLATQTDLNGQLVPEAVAVRDIERVVLLQSTERGIVLIQFLLFVVAVVGLRERLTPGECGLEASLETRLGIGFPLIVERKVSCLVGVEGRLFLAGRVLAGFYLGVVPVLIPREVAVLASEHELMSAQFKGIVELRLSARMPVIAFLNAVVVTQRVEGRVGRQQIRTVIDRVSAQSSRLRRHRKA